MQGDSTAFSLDYQVFFFSFAKKKMWEECEKLIMLESISQSDVSD